MLVYDNKRIFIFKSFSLSAFRFLYPDKTQQSTISVEALVVGGQILNWSNHGVAPAVELPVNLLSHL